MDSLFARKYDRYRLMVWGARAKGTTFVNVIDPDRIFIAALIDINPEKQNQYITKTAHKFYRADVLRAKKGKIVLVMNENYFDQIANIVTNPDITLYALRVL